MARKDFRARQRLGVVRVSVVQLIQSQQRYCYFPCLSFSSAVVAKAPGIVILLPMCVFVAL